MATAHMEERGCERGTHKADGIGLNKSYYQHSIILTTNAGIARIRADSSGDEVLSGVAWKSRLVALAPEPPQRLKTHVSDAVLSRAHPHWFRDSVMTEQSSTSAAPSSSTSGLYTVRRESKRRPCR